MDESEKYSKSEIDSKKVHLNQILRRTKESMTDKRIIVLDALVCLETLGIIRSEMERIHDGCNGEKQWVRFYKPKSEEKIREETKTFSKEDLNKVGAELAWISIYKRNNHDATSKEIWDKFHEKKREGYRKDASVFLLSLNLKEEAKIREDERKKILLWLSQRTQLWSGKPRDYADILLKELKTQKIL